MADEDCDDRLDRFDRRPVSTGAAAIGAGWIWAVLIVLGIGAIGVLLWTFGVFTSGIKGAGDAEVYKNSAANRIRAQEGFETLYQQIKVADRNLTMTAIQLSAKPDSDKLSTEALGQQQYCNDLVGQYDAKARKFTQAEFRAADLPHEIDMNDPQTDCKG